MNATVIDPTITSYEALPEAVKAQYVHIPTAGDDLLHTFNAETGLWMAHCNCCGTPVDEQSDLPATDFLCDPCYMGDDEDQN